MRKISWSDEAEFDYEENINYLLNKWTELDAVEFVQNVSKIILNLENDFVRYKSSTYKDIKMCVVCKQITLYYRVKSKFEIELVRFWNTNKDPKRLNL